MADTGDCKANQPFGDPARRHEAGGQNKEWNGQERVMLTCSKQRYRHRSERVVGKEDDKQD